MLDANERSSMVAVKFQSLDLWGKFESQL